jgi:hypothetical protein
LTDEEMLSIKNKLRGMVNDMSQGGAIPGMSEADSEILAALTQQQQQGGSSKESS